MRLVFFFFYGLKWLTQFAAASRIETIQLYARQRRPFLVLTD